MPDFDQIDYLNGYRVLNSIKVRYIKANFSTDLDEKIRLIDMLLKNSRGKGNAYGNKKKYPPAKRGGGELLLY